MKMPKFVERWIAKKAMQYLIKKIDNMKGSWKTTLAGWAGVIVGAGGIVIAVLTGQGFDAGPLLESFGEVGVIVPAWIAGVIGLFSRDDGVSSEEVAEAAG